MSETTPQMEEPTTREERAKWIRELGEYGIIQGYNLDEDWPHTEFRRLLNDVDRLEVHVGRLLIALHKEYGIEEGDE